MNRSFKIMRESSKPRGFAYECVDGHEWFIKAEDYNSVRYNEDGTYKPNPCPTCLLTPEESACPTVSESSTSC